MIRIDIHNALPDMVLAGDVAHPQRPSSPLMRAGVRLSAKSIDRLVDLGAEHVWVEYAPLSSVRNFHSATIARCRERFVTCAAESFAQFHARNTARGMWDALGEVVADIADTLLHDRAGAIFVNGPSTGEFWAAHGANTAYLSLLIGLKTGGYLVRQRKGLSTAEATNLTTLVTGALLHDIGLLGLDADVLSRWLDTRDESDAEWQKHVELGHRALNGQIEGPAGAVVVQHHQYFNGSGFPLRQSWSGATAAMSGEAIHVLSRIVTVADQFDEYRMSRQLGPMPHVQTLAHLLHPARIGRFDPVILRTLLELVPAYLPGSEVRLSDGRAGYVATWNLEDPCRPRIALIADSADLVSEGPAPEIVDLAQDRSIGIVESEGEDVSDCQFELPSSVRPTGGAGLQFRTSQAA